MINPRPASLDDFVQLYSLGKKTLQLRVSVNEEFMDADEFKWSITNPHGAFLVAEENQKIIGFIYANAQDIERPFEHKYACLVYLVVQPEFRGKGIAQRLYSACEKRLKELGISHIYGWASLEGDGAIINFMKKQGFAAGHKYLWMDKKIF